MIKVYTEPMEDGPINLASKSSQPIVDSNSNQVDCDDQDNGSADYGDYTDNHTDDDYNDFNDSFIKCWNHHCHPPPGAAP